MAVPSYDNFRHYVDDFNAMDPEEVVNLIPNAQAWTWMKENIPFFSCPDGEMERMYYFRWWTYRKHIKQTPVGRILTEFITPVRHAGSYNSISCALGHHIAEGRWLADTGLLDEYIRFWFVADDGKPEPKFHNYSSWLAAAVVQRCGVTGQRDFALQLLDDLIADYRRWEQERGLPNGMFWQYDVRDGMEESISGSRTKKNGRPTINSYMYGNASAIATVAGWAGRPDVVAEFEQKAAALKHLVQTHLWDDHAAFFKAQTNEGPLCDTREEIGFIPWCFGLPDAGYEQAWTQLIDPRGFWAPFGITTAERRSPHFRTHGVGDCEWDGAVWPFATSQTLDALATLLRDYQQPHVTGQDYLNALRVYTRSQHWEGEPYNGHPYIGEYLDETTGRWLKGDNPRSRYYNHSTYCDLIISGLVGLQPDCDPNAVSIHPLLPEGSWEWFWLDHVPYHGRKLTIRWDRHGQRFGMGAGLVLLSDGRELARSDQLRPMTAQLNANPTGGL